MNATLCRAAAGREHIRVGDAKVNKFLDSVGYSGVGYSGRLVSDSAAAMRNASV